MIALHSCTVTVGGIFSRRPAPKPRSGLRASATSPFSPVLRPCGGSRDTPVGCASTQSVIQLFAMIKPLRPFVNSFFPISKNFIPPPQILPPQPPLKPGDEAILRLAAAAAGAQHHHVDAMADRVFHQGVLHILGPEQVQFRPCQLGCGKQVFDGVPLKGRAIKLCPVCTQCTTCNAPWPAARSTPLAISLSQLFWVVTQTMISIPLLVSDAFFILDGVLYLVRQLGRPGGA